VRELCGQVALQATCSAHAAGLVADLAQQVAELQEQMSEYALLAEYNEYIGLFNTFLVDLVRESDVVQGNPKLCFELLTWDDVARHLFVESGRPEAAQVVTNVVKTALGTMGMTWDEWVDLGAVAEAPVGFMHTSTDAADGGLRSALSRLDSLPPRLSSSKAALRRALEYCEMQGCS
jgi:hypothetical protein